MNFVTVRGQLTLENTDVQFTIFPEEMTRLREIEPRVDEREHYRKLSDQVTNAIIARREPTDRAIVVANQPDRETKTHCITLIQLLLGRSVNVMMVYMRSSSTRRLGSDLGFLSRLGSVYGVDEINVTVGSFHVELAPEEI